MPLTNENRAAIYSDRFVTNTRTVMGEQGHMILDLRTQLDVAQSEIGVLNDEIAALTKERDDLKAWKEAHEAVAANAGSAASVA